MRGDVIEVYIDVYIIKGAGSKVNAKLLLSKSYRTENRVY